jgi:hypothetical protein
MEISKREDIVCKPNNIEIVPLYNDIPPYSLYIMHPVEIIAEKVRAIMSRAKARDVYDLWFLLKKGIKPDMELIGKKLAYYNKSFEYSKFSHSIAKCSLIWNNELSQLLGAVPNFSDIRNYILKNFHLNNHLN